MSMRAVEIIPPGILQCNSIALPIPKKGELRIRVSACGVNRADILQRQGTYPPPPHASPLPGLEISGFVEETGAGCTRFQPGDAVCALLSGGGYAEYAIAPESTCWPVPEGWRMPEAAALPEALCTAWLALVEKGKLKKGERVLIHGGASGVGLMAIQLATLLGATVYATAGTEAKCRACEQAGAVRAVCYRDRDFQEALSSETGGGVQLILDMVGGSYIGLNLSLLSPRGRLVMIAFMQGARTDASLAPILFKELTVTGFTLRSQPLARKARLMRDIAARLGPALHGGKLKPLIDREFPLEDAQNAHKYMENNLNIGKIVLLT